MTAHLATLTYQVPAELVPAVGEAVIAVLNAGSSNGRTADFESVNAGSTPALATNSPDQLCVQASAAEDRRTASAATHQPETATKSPLKQAAEAVSERTAIMVAPATGVAEAGVSGQPETIPALTGQFPGANVSGLERAGVTAGETAPNSSPATSQGADGHPEPSSDALPAGPPKGDGNGKSERAVTNSPEREPGNPEVSAICNTRVSSGDSRPAARGPLENAAESPAGDPIRKRPSFRPNCQNRSLCASGTRDHCHSCKKAMSESEAA